LRSIGIEFVAFDWSIAFKHTQTEAKNDNGDTALVATSVALHIPVMGISHSDFIRITNL